VTKVDQGAAAGTRGIALRFVNTGSVTCTLNGHPGVSFVTGPDGRQVGASAVRRGTSARVTLPASGVAYASVGIGTAENYPVADCVPTPVRGFRVFPPDQRASVFVADSDTGCASASVPLLSVSEVKAGPPDEPGA
jgi:hypothetical protein